MNPQEITEITYQCVRAETIAAIKKNNDSLRRQLKRVNDEFDAAMFWLDLGVPFMYYSNK